jgi:hypothetical protein
MEDKGERSSIFLDPLGVFDPLTSVKRRMVGEWSELRIKVGCGQKVNVCPVWRLRLDT